MLPRNYFQPFKCSLFRMFMAKKKNRRTYKQNYYHNCRDCNYLYGWFRRS